MTFFSSSFPQALTAEHTTWFGISLCSFWVSCPSCVFSLPLAYPQLTCWAKEYKTRSFDIVQALFSKSKTWCVTNTIVVINLKQSTVWAAMKKINFQPRPLQSSLFISYQLCTIRYILINHNSSCCPVVYTWIFFPWSVSHPLKMSIRCSFSYLVHVLGYTYYVVA